MKRVHGFVGTIVALASLLISSPAWAASYYVNNATGNDAAAGTREAPWRSVAKVNGAALRGGDIVFFQAGQTWNEVLYPRSGAAGSPIIYRSYNAAGAAGSDASFRTTSRPVLSGMHTSDNYETSYFTAQNLAFQSGQSSVILLANAHHAVIDDCLVRSTTSAWAPVIQLRTHAHHNRILRSDIAFNAYYAMNDVINLRNDANFNLIEDNVISVTGGHLAVSIEGAEGANPKVGSGHYNIVRNNRIISAGGSAFATMSNSDHNLFENNVVSGCGLNSRGLTEGGFTVDTRFNIIRRNILRDKDCPDARGIMMQANNSAYPNNVHFNRVYNNIVTNVSAVGQGIYLGHNGDGGVSTENNVFKNNAIYNNGGKPLQTDSFGTLAPSNLNVQVLVDPQAAAVSTNNSFRNNLFFKGTEPNLLWVAGQFFSIAAIEGSSSIYRSLYSGNVWKDPMFDAEFKPRAGSPVVDAGDFLTNVTSPSGSGPVITVADAYYFSDGYGMIAGDTIQVGSAVTTIRSISGNTLTVSPAISWVSGAPVSLPYAGNAPDIGVFESGFVGDPIPDPTPTVTPTPTPTVPAGLTISSSWTGNGSVSPAGVISVTAGQNLTLTITPSFGSYTASVKADGVVVASNVGATTHSFNGITASHTLEVAFATSTFDISASAGPNGSISPAGVSTVSFGSSRTYAITPASGYVVDSVVVDGIARGALTSFTFSNIDANHSIAATFKVAPIAQLSIVASATAGGTISPAGTSLVNRGGSLSYTITPSYGFYTASVSADGAVVRSNTGSTTFAFTNVTSNHRIDAVFAASTFDITASAGPNGSISPAGVSTVPFGSSRTYAITPASGYVVDSVVVDGTARGALTSFTFSAIAANHSIAATFKPAPIPQFSIVATAGAGGTISPSGTRLVNRGASQAYTITPAAGYVVASVVVDGVSRGAIRSFTFSNVIANHTISATFRRNQFTLTAAASVGGSISPVGTSYVNPGGSLTYRITPAVGYYTDRVLVDGALRLSNLGTTSYTFSNVTANHTISVAFRPVDVTITATAGANGSISPSGAVAVTSGGSRTFTFTPAAGYVIDTIFVDGVWATRNASYTFTNVTVPHKIHATFKPSWAWW